MHEDCPIKQNCQGKIGQRSRRNDHASFADTLAIKGTMTFFFSHLAFTLIEHFYVAAQRENTDCPFGLIRTEAPLPQHSPEPNGKTQDLDATSPCRQVMPKFMDNDKNTENDDKGYEIKHEVAHAKQRSRTIRKAT